MIQKNLLGKEATKYKRCDNCGKDKPDYDVFNVALYHPFNTEPSYEGNICQKCYDYADIHYCDGCGREIYESNGYRRNIRINNQDEPVCVACLQKEWFKEGMDKFQDADWFNDGDLALSDFKKHGSYFCRSEQSYKDAESVFNSLQKLGNKVIVSIERSGMGLEHFIAIWTKE